MKTMDGMLNTLEIIGLNVCAAAGTIITINPDWLPPLTVIQTLLTIMVQAAALTLAVMKLHSGIRAIYNRRKRRKK